MTEYNEGDLVEAVKGELLLRGRITHTPVGAGVVFAPGSFLTSTLKFAGYTITVIEKAAAVVVLPTEAGAYLDKQSDVWVLDRHGEWMCPDSPSDNDQALNYAPFIRLEPVAVTAKKVLDRVDEWYAVGEKRTLSEFLEALRLEFEATK